jgi:DNA uptake protein ComE-like DNA-binding protein
LAAGGLILDEAASVVESGLAPLTFPEEPKKEVASGGSDENAAQITEASVLELLNAGSKPELQTLRLIGEQRAEMIVQFREKHGPLTSIDQLNEIGLKAFKPRAFLDANLKHGVPLTTTM